MICEKKNLMLAFFGRVAGKIIAEFQYFYLHYQAYMMPLADWNILNLILCTTLIYRTL